MPRDKDQADEPDSELSMRDKLLSRLSPEALEITQREVSVMTRLSTDIVEVLDSLVKLGLFKSRSEVVAAVIEKTILSQKELFEDIKMQAEKLDEIQDTAKDLVYEALRGKD